MVDAVGGRRVGFAGHAAFETYSVLSRLPSPLRRTPRAAQALVAAELATSRFLGAAEAQRLLAGLAALGIAGGAVYDALVGAAAAQHGVRLATRDRRALETYRALDLEVELLT